MPSPPTGLPAASVLRREPPPRLDRNFALGMQKLLRRLRLEGPALALLPHVRRWSGSLTGRDRRRVRAYLAASGEKKLQIGAGSNHLDGWLNTDYSQWRVGQIYLNAARPFPLPDASFDYVFSEHMIEHIPFRAGLEMLRESHRVLRPGGRVRITTPDLAFLIALQRDERSDLEDRYIDWASRTFTPDLPANNLAVVLNNYVRDWGHRFIYDAATLRHALSSTGFVDVVAFEGSMSDTPALRGLEFTSRMPEGFHALESLSMEARKPG